MAKDIVFDRELNQLVLDHISIFEYEYAHLGKKIWYDFKTKPNCSCRTKIFKEFQKDSSKFNQIISKLLNEEVIVYFQRPVPEPIVKEFTNLGDMENFLRDLKSKGLLIRSATPSPNGKGGFIIVIL